MSTVPRKATFRSTTASSGVGSAARSTPRIATLIGVPISMITPSLRLISGGELHVISAIGPTRNWPSSIGNVSSRSRMILSIRRMMSGREEDAVGRAGAQPDPQAVEVDAAVEAEQAARARRRRTRSPA